MDIPWWLRVWARWSANDAAEIRALWYPAHTPALAGGWARGEHFWEDQEGDLDASLAQAVDLAVDGLPGPLKHAVLWAMEMRRGDRPSSLEVSYADAVARLRSAVLAKGFVL